MANFIWLLNRNTKKQVLVPVDRIIFIQSAEKGSDISLDSGDVIGVDEDILPLQEKLKHIFLG